MELDDAVLTPQERLAMKLRRLYNAAGFRHYRMSRFEEYSLYQENRRFLTSDQVIAFTDLDGRLLALKPDVTLSIAKNAAVEPGECGRYWYYENVYRPGRESHGFREIRQMGLECVGAVDTAATAEALSLAVATLDAAERPRILEAGHMGFIAGLLDAVLAPTGSGTADPADPSNPDALRAKLLRCLRDRKYHAIEKLCREAGRGEAETLLSVSDLSGDWETVLCAAGKLCRNAVMEAAVEELSALWERLSQEGRTAGVRLDLSLVNDMEYYNGLVFQGFLEGLPRAVLRGGRYDPLAARFRPGARAVGFALYLDELERLDQMTPQDQTEPAGQMLSPEQDREAGQGREAGQREQPNAAPIRRPEEILSVALPKGRLGDQVLRLLERAGYGTVEESGRKLVMENPEAGIRYFLVKPGDVHVYVERGAADVGIAGRDTLKEHNADVYELLDTGLGRCRMCVAAPAGYRDDPERTLRVATKFVRIAKSCFADRGREIDIIKLHGSIELAPLLGLSDVIVDIVETGTTLKANGLHVVEEFLPVSARLIANRSSYQFKRRAITELAEKLREVTEE